MDKSRQALKAGKVSPIVDRSFKFQRKNFPPQRLLAWACTNFFLALILFLEVKFNIVLELLGLDDGNVANGCLVVIAVILLINSLLDVSQAATTSVKPPVLPLSPEQKKLMGVKSDMAIFQDTSVLDTPNRSINSPSLQFSLAHVNSKTSSSRSTPYRYSFEQSHTASPQLGSRRSPSPDLSYFNKSSPFFPRSPVFNSSGESFLSPARKSPFCNSPLPEEDFMTDQKTLNSYLKAHFEVTQSKTISFGADLSQPQSWGHVTSIGSECMADLSKTAYQLSARSPKSPVRNKDNRDDFSKVASSEYWTHAGIKEGSIREAVARLRQWIVLIILRGLVREIDQVNKLLQHHGFSEVQVGESSLNSLKQVHLSKRNELVKLAWLLPFLEVTSHQEYLVDRIRTLAAGGYMSDFKWNKGGVPKDRKEWNDDLITDSELIMYLFCVFMDLHLPNDPRFPDGKSFSSQYFVKTPDKPKMAKIDDKMVVYQNQLHPPNYRLVTKVVAYDVPPGRHNMLCALLLFLHHLKTKKHSMLGQVNLGLSGINVLYVVEPMENQSEN